MRNPMKRRPSSEPKPTLRERLRATKARAGKGVAVYRVLLAPVPEPEPAADRALLKNYATFLYRERQAACAGLYPHMGTRAT